MNKINVNQIDKLSETAMKRGSYNFLLGLVAVVLMTLLAGLGYIIQQNSSVIASLPKDMALLTQKFDSMDRKLEKLEYVDRKVDKISDIDRKLDYIFLDKIKTISEEKNK